MIRVTRVKGFVDSLASQSLTMTCLEQTAQKIFERYGYQELRLPILEKTELFCHSIGRDTDVIGKEMYTFPDRKGRSLTLRPEATAGIMRAYIENKMYAQTTSAKLYTYGPMFRYERPQKGRLRQFYQINAECLGLPEPQADAETIAMLWDYLNMLGIKELSLLVNSLGCRVCRHIYRNQLAEFFHDVDIASLCEDCRRRTNTNPLRVLDCKASRCQSQIATAPIALDSNCLACRQHLDAVLRLLSSLKIPYVLAPRLVRGLDYYYRTTFEVVSATATNTQSAVAGGGRYDGLVAALGGPDIAGVGFACGMERLAKLLPQPKPQRPYFYIAVLDHNAQEPAFLLCQQLRQAGLHGEIGFCTKSLKSQMRTANKLQAAACLLLGSDELATGYVQVKALHAATQSIHSIDDPNGLACLLVSLAAPLSAHT